MRDQILVPRKERRNGCRDTDLNELRSPKTKFEPLFLDDKKACCEACLRFRFHVQFECWMFSHHFQLKEYGNDKFLLENKLTSIKNSIS